MKIYIRPKFEIIDLTADDALIGANRCNGGAWSAGGCS